MNRLPRVLVLLLLAVGLTSCFGPLLSQLPTDVVITIGYHNPADRSLAPTQLQGGVGGTLEVPVEISLLAGTTLESAYTVSFVFSVDGDLATTGDNTSVADPVSITAGGVQVAELTVPASLVAGTYRLFATINEAGDSTENNNTASIPVELGANQPDLTITISTAGYAQPEEDLPVAVIIRNEGFAKLAAGTTVGVQYRVNLSGTDTELKAGSYTLESDLYPLSTLRIEEAVPMPTLAQMADDAGVTTEELGEWSDTLEAEVDQDGAITEVDETNNIDDATTLTYVAAKPDLEITSFELEGGDRVAKIGSAAEIQLTLKNNGGAVASDYSVEVYVDVDSSGDKTTGDLTVHSFPAEALPTVTYDRDGDNNTVFLSTTEESTGTWPASLTDGTYRVIAEATVAGDYDDTNDQFSIFSMTLLETVKDLVVTGMSSSLTTALDEATGGTIPLSVTISNLGDDEVTTDFELQLYASSDATFDPTDPPNPMLGPDIDLGAHTITDAVPAGGSVTASFDLAFPAGSGGGFYTLWWVLDSGGVVEETDELNNDTRDIGGQDAAFEYFLVDDGSDTYGQARLLVYKPMNAVAEYADLLVHAYSDNWSTFLFYVSGGAINPGDRYTHGASFIDPGEDRGLRFYTNSWNVGAPYVFRFVPDYVNQVNEYAVPRAGAGEDPYEENDTEATAAALSGTNNPLYGWVTAYALPYGLNNYNYDYDYFTFNVPDVTP